MIVINYHFDQAYIDPILDLQLFGLNIIVCIDPTMH
ncbi:hypothetical protein HISP_10815 [Haloarcula hispanica N601]|uniref:Uncharacterized protein n=1 Tax=Haloarcula hispanica N601 TaxID=1417673 RepID=V5TQA9_HALHI|nr:hypothetical protein HISP_10815 [Haloarcula hispanica N601]